MLPIRLALFIILYATLSSLYASSPTQQTENLPEYSRTYDPQRDVFKDAHAAIKRASSTGKRIIVELGGNWCQWCLRLDKFIKDDTELNHALHKHFVLLKVNVSEQNKNTEFLKAFPKITTYPHMFVTENDGRIIYSKDTSEFLQNGKYKKENIMAFIQRWKPVKTQSQEVK